MVNIYHSNMKAIYTLLFLFTMHSMLRAQIQIVQNAQPTGRIILNNQDTAAAHLLNQFVYKITGTMLPVINNSADYNKGDIIIATTDDNNTAITPDGYKLSSNNRYLKVTGGNGKGALYAIVHLIENFFNVQYYAANALAYSQRHDLSLPENIHILENPSFAYRQTQAYSMQEDPLYKVWFRLEEPRSIFAANYWVHTFDRILPSARYGHTHPEFYSFINGRRRPGAASQWCLSNLQLFEVAAKQIDSIFKANPGKNIISVSQNDGNNTHCTCPDCKAVDDAEGSPSGSLIRFLNKLATRFPDKQFSTLAYLYSMKPPQITKPMANVNIMLCDIDCYREVTLTENPSGREFVQAMEGWAKISDNIFLWDYGINFDNYVSPFPNFHILQSNMQLFKKNHVTMHFSQIGGSKGGDFSELRSYIVAKLMWNVTYNTDSLIQSFLNGYYGAAAPYLYQYIKMQEGALLGSNMGLWIYDTPITHKNGMLNAALVRRYHTLFDKAEKAVKSNQILLERVQRQRLSLQYASLEIARTTALDDVEHIKKELLLFRQRAKTLGVTTLNERNNTIEEYCDLYLLRNLPAAKESLAKEASVVYIKPPTKPYDIIAPTALTDGLLGGATFNESWVGWEGKDAEFIIDLGAIKEIKTVEADMLHKLGAWILLPKSFACYTSEDNVNYFLMGRKDIAEDRSPEVKYVTISVNSPEKIRARYIKVFVETIGPCPSWHYGVGYPAWFFIDEVKVF